MGFTVSANYSRNEPKKKLKIISEIVQLYKTQFISNNDDEMFLKSAGNLYIHLYRGEGLFPFLGLFRRFVAALLGR